MTKVGNKQTCFLIILIVLIAGLMFLPITSDSQEGTDIGKDTVKTDSIAPTKPSPPPTPPAQEEPPEEEGFLTGIINWVKSLFGQEEEETEESQVLKPKPRTQPKPQPSPTAQKTKVDSESVANKPSVEKPDVSKEPEGKPVVSTQTSKPKVLMDEEIVEEEKAINEPKYVYRRGGRRDPFASLVEVNQPSKEDGQKGKVPQEEGQLDVASIQLTGILDSVDGRVALVRDKNGFAYFLQEGDPVNEGYVHSIYEDEIVFELEDVFTGSQLVPKRLGVSGSAISQDAQFLNYVQQRLQQEGTETEDTRRSEE